MNDVTYVASDAPVDGVSHLLLASGHSDPHLPLLHASYLFMRFCPVSVCGCPNISGARAHQKSCLSRWLQPGL